MSAIYNNLKYTNDTFTFLVAPINDDIEEVNLHPNTKYIRTECFKWCEKLKTVKANCKNLSKIGPKAFAYCKNLENLEIVSDEIIIVGQDVFKDCKNVKNIKISKIDATFNSFDDNLDKSLINLTLINMKSFRDFNKYFYHNFCLAKNIENIKTKINGKWYENFIGETDLCFYPEHKKEKTIIIPDTFKNINSGSINNNYIEEVFIGKNISTIYARGFENCKNLKSATIESDNITLFKDSFYKCENLKEIILTQKAYEKNILVTAGNEKYRINNLDFLLEKGKSFKQINSILKEKEHDNDR